MRVEENDVDHLIIEQIFHTVVTIEFFQVSVGTPYTTVTYNLVSMADAVYVRFAIPPLAVSSGMPAVQLEFHGCVTATLAVPVAGIPVH